MKITETRLREIIKEEIAREINFRKTLHLIEGSGSNLPPGSGRIWVGGRSITGPADIGKHAWIMIKKPGDPANPIISLSGKSGVGFEAGALSAFFRKISKGSARDWTADFVASEISKAYSSGRALKTELLDALEKTSWGPLRKRINYAPDTFKNASDLWEITPDNEEDAKAAISDVLSAYKSYGQTAPYDPLPGITSSEPGARNSNSFARTLLDAARKGRSQSMPSLSGFNVEEYPGWHLTVPVAISNS